MCFCFFFFKQKTAYEMRISDWSSDVCSSDLLKDRLTRVDGIGDVQVFGARDYAMRVWIDPGRAAELGLTAGDIVAALRAQNVQIAAGVVGQPPFDTGAAHQLNVQTQGRFKTADEFPNIIVRTDPTGAYTRLHDVARVELGAED